MKIIFDAAWLADERIQEREWRGSKPKIDCNFMFFEILNNNNKNKMEKKRNEMWKNKRRRRSLKIQLLRIFLIQRLKDDVQRKAKTMHSIE